MPAETPVWREAGGQYPLCNACGVFYKTNGTNRVPPHLVEATEQALPRPVRKTKQQRTTAAPPVPAPAAAFPAEQPPQEFMQVGSCCCVDS